MGSETREQHGGMSIQEAVRNELGVYQCLYNMEV